MQMNRRTSLSKVSRACQIILESNKQCPSRVRNQHFHVSRLLIMNQLSYFFLFNVSIRLNKSAKTAQKEFLRDFNRGRSTLVSYFQTKVHLSCFWGHDSVLAQMINQNTLQLSSSDITFLAYFSLIKSLRYISIHYLSCNLALIMLSFHESKTDSFMDQLRARKFSIKESTRP